MVYQRTYKDALTGEKKKTDTYFFDFRFAGLRHKGSTHVTSLTRARAFESDYKKRLQNALAGLPTEKSEDRIKSVSDMVKPYLEHYGINHREKSLAFATGRLEHVKRLLGSTLLPDLTEDAIRTYARTRLDEGVSGRTVNMEIGELSRAIGRTWSALWPKVRKLEENHDVGRSLEEEEERRLLDAAASDASPNRNPLVYPYIQTALLTGMRDGEIKNTRWTQLSFERDMVTVGKKAKTRKGSGREIPMNPNLRAVLEQHAAWYIEKFGRIEPDWYVFPGKKGRPQKGIERPMDPTIPLGSIAKAWDTLRERAGVKCRFHDLRHTFCTKLAEDPTVGEETMKSIMGHMSAAMLERYSHIRVAAKRRAVAGIRLANAPKPGTGETVDGVPSKVPPVADVKVIN